MVLHDMSYRPLGRCGMKVSALSLGGWTTFGESVMDTNAIQTILHKAFDRGINFFDIADVYNRGKTESAMGAVLRDFPRNELVISSKVFFPMSDHINDKGLSRKHIMESIEGSLKRIGTDYLDIYFCHRFDKETPLEETARAMDDLVHQGKVLYWGTSDWTGEQLRDVHAICEQHHLYRPQVEQPRYNLFTRGPFEQDVSPAASELGMGLVTFSPLAYGILSGKYDDGIPRGARLDRIEWLRDRYFSETYLQRVRDLKAHADQQQCTRAQLVLAWILSHPHVSSVITGATRLEQFEENLGALQVEMTDDLKNTIQALFPVE